MDALAGKFDVCIVGAGPAGMILALELERVAPDRSILLLEYGSSDAGPRNALDDCIRVADPLHHHEPYECTNKGLGGTSATWGGRCVMYDPVDFVPRAPFAKDCTWPDGIEAGLAPHLARAQEYFECAPGGFSLHDIPGIDYRPIAEGFREGDVLDSVVEKWSRPTRFGSRYGERLRRSKAVTIATGWQLLRIGADAGGTVTSASVREVASGRETEVRAGAFVLAAGAQETTRVLFRSPDIFRPRGGTPAALGRFYQGHLSGKIASVQFTGDARRTDYGFARTAGGEYVRRRFQFPMRVLAERRILNTAIWLDNPPYVDPAHRSGAMSFMYLAMLTPWLGRRLAPPAVAHSITKGKRHAVGAHVLNILRDLPVSLWIPASIFVRRYCFRRKLPGVFLPSRSNRYALHFHAEQIPTEVNRMELAADGETLVIHYGYTDEDVASVLRAHAALDEWLRACGCGRVEYWHPPGQLAAKIREGSKDGVHQVGTTRMSARAEEGVVDGNLRVWGTRNLYVCSSSVFPTSGQANPTFLLGVFAARLADHLATHALR